jgi:hypothetical protein
MRHKSDLYIGILNNVVPLSFPLDMYRIGYCSGSGQGKEHIYTKEDNPKKTMRRKSDLLTGICFYSYKVAPFSSPLYNILYRYVCSGYG